MSKNSPSGPGTPRFGRGADSKTVSTTMKFRETIGGTGVKIVEVSLVSVSLEDLAVIS